MSSGESIAERNLRLFGSQRPVAFVTGSSAPRVGKVIADYLAAEDFHVVRHGHHPNERANHPRAALQDAGTLFLWGAVEEEDNVVAWTTQIEQKYGRIDLLVNSAAIWDPKTLETTTAADFEKYFRVNALGTALTCQHFGLWMARQSTGGCIVNIGDWAIKRPYRDFAAYFASKGAVPMITQSMAVELATRNPRVRVNAVLPGPVMLADSISEDDRQKIARECLLQREGTAADVASAIVFLATSPFITGVCLPVDGGRSVYAGPSTDPIAHPSANQHP